YFPFCIPLLRIQVTQGKNRVNGRSLTHFSYCFLQHGRIAMKDFAIRVKNLSTHRFPLWNRPRKRVFCSKRCRA
ncbi:MAG: hypothetical protein IJO01_00520, partial [Oscillospiraceae bacterium]|nr:hypothetical protein [Oscillospiraceae bacterium]